MKLIELAQVANQEFSLTEDNNRFKITINNINSMMSITIEVNNNIILSGQRLLPNQLVIQYGYLSKFGNFLMTTQNDEMPDFNQFGVDQFFYFLTKAEVDAL